MSHGKWFKPAKNILFTGAGFTKNFGGYLASEMWSAIFNEPEIRKSNKLRSYMLQESNYETVYDTVLNSSQYDSEKEGFKRAIRRVYGRMHSAIVQGTFASRAISAAFLKNFAGRRESRELGFFFTLNHDLFVEKFNSDSYYSPWLCRAPGIHSANWFNLKLPEELSKEDEIPLPDEESLKKTKHNFWSKSSTSLAYVKIHGSFGWKKKDGDDCMVIGRAKSELLQSEPLLRWYLELFEEVLREPKRNLVIIGYGFGDKHINDMIASAIHSSGLRLYVVSPMVPHEFENFLDPIHGTGQSKPRGRELWEGLHAYYPGRMTDICDFESGNLKSLGEDLFRHLDDW